ncbi:MAG: VOC family protein [Gammaproteobacteria bacterium]|nr:VOC family protein [Gammaproteobacteria bacterium]
MSDAMKQHGAFSWNELLTTDVAAAKVFYGGLLGWSLNEIDVDGLAYTMAKANDTEVAGIMAIPEEAKGMPPTWGGYITVDDVDAAVARAEQLGGKVLCPPRDCSGVGRFSVIQDPQGAMVSLITYFKKE